MALSYRQFLNKKWGAGAASNEHRAAAWRRQEQAKKPPPGGPPAQVVGAPVVAQRASFTPGALDESGSRNKGQLDFNYNTGQNYSNMDYQQGIAELDALQPQLDHTRDLGYQNADNNAAGRGMFNSGIRQQNRTNVGADYDQAVRDMARRRMNLTNRHQLDVDTATGQYGIDSSNNMIDSNVRQKGAFEDANPVVTPPTPEPAAKVVPKVKYAAWLKGRPSTATNAAAWRRAMGMGG